MEIDISEVGAIGAGITASLAGKTCLSLIIPPPSQAEQYMESLKDTFRKAFCGLFPDLKKIFFVGILIWVVRSLSLDSGIQQQLREKGSSTKPKYSVEKKKGMVREWFNTTEKDVI